MTDKTVRIACTGAALLEIDKITPFQGELKTLSADNYEKLKQSILALGFSFPIHVWKHKGWNYCVDGHQRDRVLLQMKKDGYKIPPVPVVWIEAASEKEAKLKILAATSSYGEMQSQGLYEFIEQVGVDAQKIFDTFTFPEIDPQQFMDEFYTDPVMDKDDEVPAVTKTNIKLGDMFQLGSHKLLCGDATKAEDVVKLMGKEKADMILTDPPYGMDLNTDWSGAIGAIGHIGHRTKGKKYNKVIGDNQPFKPEFLLKTFKDVKEIFLFGADYYAESISKKNDGSWLIWDKRKESQSEGFGSEFETIWSKKKHKRRILRHDWFGFLSSNNAKEVSNRLHPTQKPTSLLMDIMNQWGKPDDIIIDIYAGSGSTLIACEKTKRKCRMMEISESYCEVICQRWEDFTGKKRIKCDQKQ